MATDIQISNWTAPGAQDAAKVTYDSAKDVLRRSAEVRRWSIRRMKTKWGSCNRETAHIWFNLELAKKPPRALGYIVVHEMVHLLERNHGERFTKPMDEYMSDWRNRRDDLSASPLADEDWRALGRGSHIS